MTDPVSFRQCLVHETKKAYKAYLKAAGIVLGCGLILFVLFLLYVTCRDAVWTFGSNTVGFLGFVWSALTSGIWYILTSIPWWVYLIILVASPPLLYAAGVCIQRRWKVDIGWFVINVIFCYGAGAAIGVVTAVFIAVVSIAPLPQTILPTLNLQVIAFIAFIFGTLLLLVVICNKESSGKYSWQIQDPVGASAPQTSWADTEKIIDEHSWQDKP